MSMILNRIEKNQRKLKSWAEKHKIEAYRLYDRDIPEFPVIVDRYADFFVVYDKSDSVIDAGKNQIEQTVAVLKELFQVPDEKIVLKRRQRQQGLQQYEKLNQRNEFFPLWETQAQFYVNLHDYLDTGLFLDHRPLRQVIFKKQPRRFLNLFCYTGAFSVFAALAGATTTSVDLSANYLDWAKRNFILNKVDPEKHSFVNESAIKYLEKHQDCRSFDIIFLDPPTFSNSKKMVGDFDVERDQKHLIDRAMSCLSQDGVLFFSCNKRKFKLEEAIKAQYKVADITEKTIPIDFHDKKIHQCFELRNHQVLLPDNS